MNDQPLELLRLARYLLTDVERVFGVTASETQEQQAITLFTEAFSQAAALHITPLTECPYCHALVTNVPFHCMADCAVLDKAIQQLCST